MPTNRDVQHEKWYVEAIEAIDNPPAPPDAGLDGPANREDQAFADEVRSGIQVMRDEALQDAIDAASHRTKNRDGGRTR